MLNALTEATMPLGQDRLWQVVLGAFVFTAPFLNRDFDDGGQNLMLLALSLGGIYFWTRGKPAFAGVSLGAAVALKCTPALLMLYFAWKREWKMAAVTLAAALVFTLSPIVWQGPASYARHMRVWGTQVTRSLLERNPSIGILGPEKLQNRALRPALARYLMVLPAGHPGRYEGAGYRDLGHLSPADASRVIKFLMLLLLVGIAWSFRLPAQRRPEEGLAQTSPRPEDAARVLWECAVVLMLMLLYSPITWGQHCVAVLPGVYLLLRSLLAGHKMDRWMRIVLAIVAGVILGTDRLFWGRSLALLLESYHLVTLALLALMIVPSQ